MQAVHHPLVILGSGPAGLTAAIYAARANLSPIVIDGSQPGGQLMITSDVDNYPGFEKGILGPELMEAFRNQALRFGTRFETKFVKMVSLGIDLPHHLVFDDHSKITFDSLIIATGASAKWLGLPEEKRFMGKGLSACATCDGFFFKGADIAVIGGGDTALEEATFLTRFAKSVTIIHRRDALRASKIMQQKARANPKINFLWNKLVVQIEGDQAVTGLVLKDAISGQESTHAFGGVFVAIGHEPNTKLFAHSLKLDAKGYLVVQPGTTLTSIAGVFAAGDVADSVYRQAVTAAGTGCMAAIDAERYLERLAFDGAQ
jgi:thioredoxin reductase (NADPH)